MVFVLDQVVSAFINRVIDPLVRQVGYVVKVRERVLENAHTAMTDLKARSSDLVAKVEAAEARDPLTKRSNEVEVLLSNVRDMETAVTATKADYVQRCTCVGGCLGNLYAGYKIGRKATKDKLKLDGLYIQAGELLSDVSRAIRPLPPTPGQLVPGTSNLVATEHSPNRVLQYLDDAVAENRPLTVGIYGMGGVGKTTLLRAINNSLISDVGTTCKFDHVIWVVVSSNAQVGKVQEDIAQFLPLPLEDGPLSVRIFKFLNRKRFVLLLDDIWERLDLDEIGIPDGRVVVFTTRSEAVCGQMGAHKMVRVGCLDEKEAWRLFKDKVGEQIISSSPVIKGLAKKVAAECKGLPLALVVLGRAMSSKRTPGEWQHTLTSLRKPQITGTSHIQHDVFRILKLSYDSLRDDNVRQCFLLCALFPEDWTLEPDNMLIDLFWGHGLIDVEHCNSVDEIYNLGYDRSVGVLKSACLLESSEDDVEGELIKLHDVIRDMALWIASDCGRNNSRWVVRAGLKSEEPLKGVNDWEMAEILSLPGNAMRELPMPKRRCEKLRTLILQRNRSLGHIPGAFFQYFPSLTCLDLSFVSIDELPEEVSTLTELRYLDLSGSSIQSLSMDLRKLEKLTHLKLAGCKLLNYIPHGLISGLPMLQLLDIFGGHYIFRSGKFEREENKDGSAQEEAEEERGQQVTSGEAAAPQKATLDELKSLKGRRPIRCLGLNLEMETILDLHDIVDDAYFWHLRLIRLQDSNPRDVLMTLLKTSHGTEELVLEQFEKLEELILTTGQFVGHDRRFNDHSFWCFNRLKVLQLLRFDGLRRISWKRGMLFHMFPMLTYIIIHGCRGLQNLTWTGHLPCLRKLSVRSCYKLEEIVNDDENDESTSQPHSSSIIPKYDETDDSTSRPYPSIFPKLEVLTLRYLPRLRRIVQGTVDCPCLSNIRVMGCSELKRLSFSFTSQIANKKRVFIYIDGKTWKNLEWDDENTKSYPTVTFSSAQLAYNHP